MEQRAGLFAVHIMKINASSEIKGEWVCLRLLEKTGIAKLGVPRL